MDIDAFAAVHRPEWDRLRALSSRSRLTGAEADELVILYQTTAGHLSALRTKAPDPLLVSELSGLLATARGRIAGTHEARMSDVSRFFLRSLPAAFYRVRWWTVWVGVAFVALGAVSGWWVATTPAALASLGTPAELEQYAEEAFAAYYSNYPAGDFAGQVWTNNAWIAAQCIGLGISGIWPVIVQVQNAVNVGAIGGMMAHHDAFDVFLTLIAPHGMLELTAIWIAGAAGLRIFWTWLVPGPRPRSRALAEEARALFTVAIGLVAVLGVSGLIEGFVTGSGLPAWIKIAIGAIALGAYWIYTIVLGRRAVEAGETGDLEEDLAGVTVPLAA